MKLISSKELLKTPIFRVTRDVALDPDGFEITRAVVQHGGSAVVMPVDDRKRILLVRQYRLPAKQYLWELPAGRMDPGETVLQAARRELAEETGYKARKLEKLAVFFASPGFLAEKMTIFLATGLKAGKANSHGRRAYYHAVVHAEGPRQADRVGQDSGRENADRVSYVEAIPRR